METNYTIDNLYDLLHCVGLADKKFPSEVWWRGHAEDNWSLHASVYRPMLYECGFHPQAERDLCIRFLLHAQTREARWKEDDYSKMLAVMRHHGLPTRLLDWTESALVALYFAASSAPNQSGTLWCMNPATLNFIEFGKQIILSPYSTDDVKVLFEEPFGMAKCSSDKTAAVAVCQVNLRMMTQLAQFTIHGSPSPMEEHPRTDEFLMSFAIPAKAKNDLVIQLSLLGIRLATLFPDLDHLAEEVSAIVGKTSYQENRE